MNHGEGTRAGQRIKSAAGLGGLKKLRPADLHTRGQDLIKKGKRRAEPCPRVAARWADEIDNEKLEARGKYARQQKKSKMTYPSSLCEARAKAHKGGLLGDLHGAGRFSSHEEKSSQRRTLSD